MMKNFYTHETLDLENTAPKNIQDTENCMTQKNLTTKG